MQEPLKMAGDDAPAVLYLQKILEQAAQMLASDVHVEPYEHQLRIRVRVDGVLREIDTPPLPLKDRLGRVNTNSDGCDCVGQSGAWRSRPHNSPPLSTACPSSVATSA